MSHGIEVCECGAVIRQCRCMAHTEKVISKEKCRDCLRVVAAAIRKEDGRVFSIPPPGRHHDVIREMNMNGGFRQEDEQGFLLNDGRFVGRKAALTVALYSEQIKQAKWPAHGLFSEDLW